MEIALSHWSIVGAPLVGVAGLVVFLILRRHKEPSSSAHIYR